MYLYLLVVLTVSSSSNYAFATVSVDTIEGECHMPLYCVQFIFNVLFIYFLFYNTCLVFKTNKKFRLKYTNGQKVFFLF